MSKYLKVIDPHFTNKLRNKDNPFTDLPEKVNKSEDIE